MSVTFEEKLKFITEKATDLDSRVLDELYHKLLLRTIDKSMGMYNFVEKFSGIRGLFNQRNTFEENLTRAKYVKHTLFSNFLVFDVYAVLTSLYRLRVNETPEGDNYLSHYASEDYQVNSMCMEIMRLFRDVIDVGNTDLYANVEKEINSYSYGVFISEFNMGSISVKIYKNGKIKLKGLTDSHRAKFALCLKALDEASKYYTIKFPA
jgi:hypothetical protein